MDEPSTKWMTLEITMSRSVFADLEEACLRRGLPLDQLVTDAFVRAVLVGLPNHCVTMCDACRPAN